MRKVCVGVASTQRLIKINKDTINELNLVHPL